MPKLTKQKLKQQLTLRIYDEDEYELLKKAYEMTKKGFDNISDFTRQCVVLGAEKLIGDTEVDYKLNSTEIKQILTDIRARLICHENERKADVRDQHFDNELIEKLLNYIACVVFSSDNNKAVGANIDEGLVHLPLEKIKIMDKEYKENDRYANT